MNGLLRFDHIYRILMYFVCALTILLNVTVSIAQEDSATGVSARCDALIRADFSGIQDAPTQIAAAKFMEAKESAPAYCQVQGYIAPQIGFEIRLPTDWNGKFLQLGCGGHCGYMAGYIGVATCDHGLRKGYACLMSDLGHKGAHGLWGYQNLQAKIDWGYRATHVASLAGKSITEYYYAQHPQKSYFLGCSTGGRQALQEAQRFPWDFDGIIAGSPPVNLSKIYMTFAWGMQATRDAAGKLLLRERELKLLTDAAVAKCDLDDGARDGVIGDPLSCDFDPSVLACKAGGTRHCLSSEQINAANKVYAGPMNSHGEKLWLGGPLPGSEYALFPMDWREAYGLGGKPTDHTKIMHDGFRYLFFMPEPGPAWKLSDFDFDRDYKRLGLMQAVYDSSNPDLRQFKAAGGKMIIFQDMNDISVLPRATVDYYDAVERTMGGRAATQEFARLFLMPGAQHCTSLIGVDWLSYLEEWVEKGQPPEKLIKAHIRNIDELLLDSKDNMTELTRQTDFPLDPNVIEFTRPIYPYPAKSKYLGSGNLNDAENWGSVEP